MNMRHAIYALVLSTVYAVVALTDPEVAEALTILFVALVLMPESIAWHRHRRRSGRT